MAYALRRRALGLLSAALLLLGLGAIGTSSPASAHDVGYCGHGSHQSSGWVDSHLHSHNRSDFSHIHHIYHYIPGTNTFYNEHARCGSWGTCLTPLLIVCPSLGHPEPGIPEVL